MFFTDPTWPGTSGGPESKSYPTLDVEAIARTIAGLKDDDVPTSAVELDKQRKVSQHVCSLRFAFTFSVCNPFPSILPSFISLPPSLCLPLSPSLSASPLLSFSMSSLSLSHSLSFSLSFCLSLPVFALGHLRSIRAKQWATWNFQATAEMVVLGFRSSAGGPGDPQALV